MSSPDNNPGQYPDENINSEGVDAEGRPLCLGCLAVGYCANIAQMDISVQGHETEADALEGTENYGGPYWRRSKFMSYADNVRRKVYGSSCTQQDRVSAMLSNPVDHGAIIVQRPVDLSDIMGIAEESDNE